MLGQELLEQQFPKESMVQLVRRERQRERERKTERKREGERDGDWWTVGQIDETEKWSTERGEREKRGRGGGREKECSEKNGMKAAEECTVHCLCPIKPVWRWQTGLLCRGPSLLLLHRSMGIGTNYLHLLYQKYTHSHSHSHAHSLSPSLSPTLSLLSLLHFSVSAICPTVHQSDSLTLSLYPSSPNTACGQLKTSLPTSCIRTPSHSRCTSPLLALYWTLLLRYHVTVLV